jgi:ATP-dependent exoDNAse (exonuclease V) alpha subunit
MGTNNDKSPGQRLFLRKYRRNNENPCSGLLVRRSWVRFPPGPLHTEAAAGKLILIGDHRQLPEIDAGGLFRTLTNRLPTAELTDNIRQQHPWEREALTHLRDGSVDRAIDDYRRH